MATRRKTKEPSRPYKLEIKRHEAFKPRRPKSSSSRVLASSAIAGASTAAQTSAEPVPEEVDRLLARFLMGARLSPASSAQDRAKQLQLSLRAFQMAFEAAAKEAVEEILEEVPTAQLQIAVSDQASPEELIALRESLQLKPAEFAPLLGYKERTLADWERGAKRPGVDTVRRYQELARLVRELGSVMKPEFVPVWLKLANPSFNGQPPLQLIQDRRPEELWRMIFELRYAPIA